MVHVRDVGIALEGVGTFGQLERLDTHLAHVEACGFRLVELNPTAFHLIIDGEVHGRSLSDLKAVLRNHHLRYSIHGLLRLNLAYDSRHDLCRTIMRCQLDICQAIGATVLVYHSGLQALDEARYGVRRSLLSSEELAAGAEREVRALREVAPLAADAGVVIGVENGDPHQWEYDLIARFGLPRSAISQHHARLRLEAIVRQLQRIGHASVSMALDVGHLYIAARDLGFGYLEAVERAAPWVKHLHFSDNLGLLDRGYDAEPDRWAFGEADVHMPPGWGSIPYREVLARLPNYDGDLILEIQSGFMDHASEGLRTMKELLNEG